MTSADATRDALAIVDRLCSVVPDRRPGSAGNRKAVGYVAGRFERAGWDVSLPEFGCLDWESSGGFVDLDGARIDLVPSPYGLGVDAVGPVRVVSRRSDLDRPDLGGAILVVTGDLVSEPMTPKAFPFYGSDEHTSIISALELPRPAAVVAVTGKHPELCGALDPYPWIEDGDFPIPAAAVRPADAGRLTESDGVSARIVIEATRIPSTAQNIVARLGPGGPRLTFCAHIDSKPGTPGAVDNAAGVATLVLLADRLGGHEGLPIGVELLAVNGEDHFAGPGEVAWLEENEDELSEISLFINLDGVGYRRGHTAFSGYILDDERSRWIAEVFRSHDELLEGPQWYQSDHAILAMRGRPALAFTTELVEEMLEELFHAETDTVDQVAPKKLVSLSKALEEVVLNWRSDQV